MVVFPRAVGADEAEYLALLDGEGQVVDDDGVAEPACQAADGDGMHVRSMVDGSGAMTGRRRGNGRPRIED